MTRHTFHLGTFAAAGLAAVAVAGCGDSNDTSKGGGTASTKNVSGSLSIVGVWTGDEQKSFQAVLDGFKAKFPDIGVRYDPAGDNVPTVLGTAVEGGRPPDLATVAQPGVVAEFQKKGALKSLDFAKTTISDNYPADFVKLGTIGDKLYSFVFKGANKSTVWFNVSAFKNAGVSPPKTWPEFLKNAKTLKASGVPAYSLGGADGWTLTDLFENLYLRQAGPDKYDQLATHELKWTDASVKTTLRTMAQVLGDASNIAGGKAGALQTEFPKSVENVFTDPPKAAMVIEGDFVPGVVTTKTKLKPKTGYDVFPFPAVGDATNAVVGGGDSLVLFKDTPGGRELVKYLASPEAAEIWVRRGGFSSPNKNVPASAYPDEITRTIATAIAKADAFRFDMSDLAPASFGGTAGQGEWKLLQDFLADPKDVDGTAAKLEASAAKAFK
ncbi:MAG: alpha-glucoside transport system substrate-binding protein [Solirubrobacteraceae bacterium]|nr:alpha-glucoside transport system substrate-binding protein [Solirubrobacteraceae bacterium]